MTDLFRKYRNNKLPRWAWSAALVLLILAGAGYRVVSARLGILDDTPVYLPVPLSEFPADYLGWEGRDVEMSSTVLKVAGNDDYLNRLYVDKKTGQWANVYVGYTAQPRTMLGHRPQVCYPAGGWVHDGTEETEVYSRSGRKAPALLHRFHRPAPENTEMVVLNYYILNGKFTNDESGFSAVGWRTPNIEGDIARYVAQVQISSVLENSVRIMAHDIADELMGYFPDEDGMVAVAGKDVIHPAPLPGNEE